MDMSEDKAMFAPDFLKMTREMEKKLADPNMNCDFLSALKGGASCFVEPTLTWG